MMFHMPVRKRGINMKGQKLEKIKSNKSRTTPIKRSHSSREANNDLLSERLNKFIKREAWDSIIQTIKPLLEKEHNDHWLLAEMASAYYEKRDYETAFMYIADAVSYQRNCPLMLWHLASILRMREKQEDAITIWEVDQERGKEVSLRKMWRRCWSRSIFNCRL